MNKSGVMIQGTSSDAGKSMLVIALCRWLKRRGIAVAPFKPRKKKGDVELCLVKLAKDDR